MKPTQNDIHTSTTGCEKLDVHDLETPEQNEKMEKSSSEGISTHYRSVVKWTILTFSLVVIFTVVVALPLLLRKDETSDGNEHSVFAAPFEENCPVLSEEVLQGYGSTEQFEMELIKVAESYVNGVVGRNVGLESYSSFGLFYRNSNDVELADGAENFAPTSTESDRGSPKQSVGDKVNDFGTNNQESGVEEGDNVVTDGKIAFATYGNYIVSWNVTDGSKLLKMKLSPHDDESEGSRISIHTLLLKNDLLVAAAGGYGYQAQRTKQRVLSDYAETRIFVYDVLSLGKNETKLDVLAEREVNGRYESVRSIGNDIHFVMNTHINFYAFLSEPFARYQTTFDGLADEEYTNTVRQMASEKSIPGFVEQMSTELLECGELPKMVKLNRWTTESGLDSTYSIEHFLYNNGYAQTYMTIVSFSLENVRQTLSTTLECLSVTGTFFPVGGGSTNVYSGTETMVVAVAGYNYSPSRKMYIRSTYLVSYDLNQATSFPKALGYVDGDVLSQYSFRVDGTVLELATTVQQQWNWMGTDTQIITNVPITENWVMTMDMEGANGKMEELDRLKLGKEGEVFTAVRFYDGKAYAVTFRQMDPFYVLNTTNPNDLRISGDLNNITGWSSYLEPMNDDKSVMLAIGQEADENGRTLGISISVFDAQDLQDVKIAARLLIESSTEVWSDSEGLRNKNAIRFNAETGRLILPLTIHGKTEGESFRGFRVFIVKVDSIVEEENCAVELSGFDEYYGHSFSSLEPRSMIVGGSFMSTMGSHVEMKDLDTCTTEWRLEI